MPLCLGSTKDTLPALQPLINEANHTEWIDSFKEYDDQNLKK